MLVPQIYDSNGIPVINGVLCGNSIETTPQEEIDQYFLHLHLPQTRPDHTIGN